MAQHSQMRHRPPSRSLVPLHQKDDPLLLSTNAVAGGRSKHNTNNHYASSHGHHGTIERWSAVETGLRYAGTVASNTPRFQGDPAPQRHRKLKLMSSGQKQRPQDGGEEEGGRGLGLLSVPGESSSSSSSSSTCSKLISTSVCGANNSREAGATTRGVNLESAHDPGSQPMDEEECNEGSKRGGTDPTGISASATTGAGTGLDQSRLVLGIDELPSWAKEPEWARYQDSFRTRSRESMCEVHNNMMGMGEDPPPPGNNDREGERAEASGEGAVNTGGGKGGPAPAAIRLAAMRRQAGLQRGRRAVKDLTRRRQRAAERADPKTLLRDVQTSYRSFACVMRSPVPRFSTAGLRVNDTVG